MHKERFSDPIQHLQSIKRCPTQLLLEDFFSMIIQVAPMYRLDNILVGDKVYEYQGTGLLVITNRKNKKQYVMSSRNIKEAISCMKTNTDVSKHYKEDRDKYAHLDFREVWDMYVIKLDDNIPTAKLRRLRHQMCCKLDTWYPRGYDHRTTYRTSDNYRRRTRKGTIETFKKKRQARTTKNKEKNNVNTK